MPKTLVSADRDRVFDFLKTIGGHGVIKPLDGAGGSGVLRLELDDSNARSIVDVLTHEGRRLAMVQEYLPDVKKGDKRVLLLDGELLGAINRVARADDVRSNIHVGGTVEKTECTPKERAIIAQMAPRLKADGLVFVGLDFIGERLTEVNVTSPTGIQELSRHIGRDVAVDVIEYVEEEMPITLMCARSRQGRERAFAHVRRVARRHRAQRELRRATARSQREPTPRGGQRARTRLPDHR